MQHTVVGQFDNRTLLPGMDWDMMGAFVKTEAGNKYVYRWDWVLKDNQTGLFVVMKDKEYQEKYVTNKINNMAEKTLGEKRVRVDFNVAQSSLVDQIKSKSADLINLIEDFKKEKSNGGASVLDGELVRICSLAQTEYESAAHWAVKAATYGL